MALPSQGTPYEDLYLQGGHKCTNSAMLMTLFSTCEPVNPDKAYALLSSELLNTVRIQAAVYN